MNIFAKLVHIAADLWLTVVFLVDSVAFFL